MSTPLPQQPTTPPPTPEELAAIREAERKQKTITATVIAGIVVFLALLGVAIYFLLQPNTPTDKIRDVFIIVVALDRTGRAIGQPDQPAAKRSPPHPARHQRNSQHPAWNSRIPGRKCGRTCHQAEWLSGRPDSYVRINGTKKEVK